MLFRKQNAGMRRNRNIRPIVFLPLLIVITIMISACAAVKGSIVILESLDGTGCTMEFKGWSSRNKCELSLTKDDTLRIEVLCDGGETALTIRGKNGSEPYTGNDLRSGIFTVAVSETDEYVFTVIGDNATGNVAIKNSGTKQ